MEYLLYLTIFLIPTYLVRFSVFGIPTNALEVLVGIAFLAWFISRFTIYESAFAALRLRRKVRFTIYEKYRLLLIGVSLLFLGFIMGIFVSPDIRTSLGALKGWFLVPLAFFIVARTVLVQDEQKEKALLGLALSGVGVAIIGFFYWVRGELTFDGRLAAFYESPNMLAMYIAPALLILIQKVKQKAQNHSQKPKIFNFFVVVLGFGFLILALFLARSLGALFGIFSALILTSCGYLWGKEKDYLWKTIYIGILTVGVLLPFFSLVFNPWEMGRASLASRLMIWQASIAMLKDHWFFGIGPGMFYETYLTYQKNFSPFLEWAVPHPHNISLATWLYAGLPGFIGLLLILFGFFRKTKPIPYFERSEKQGSAKAGPYTLYPIPLLIMLYLLIHGTIDNTLWRNDVAMVFWLIMGLR